MYSYFFFFKPRPAYVMLISDWRSDVCSSDLPYNERQATLARILTGQLTGVVFGQAAGGVIIEYAGWRVAFVVVVAAFALVAAALWLELRFEIGRASWRDRVCK